MHICHLAHLHNSQQIVLAESATPWNEHEGAFRNNNYEFFHIKDTSEMGVSPIRSLACMVPDKCLNYH